MKRAGKYHPAAIRIAEALKLLGWMEICRYTDRFGTINIKLKLENAGIIIAAS